MSNSRQSPCINSQVDVGNRGFNPEIISTSKEEIMIKEGCLSFPGLFFPVERAYGVSTEYYRKDGVKMSGTFVDITAKCFQHEYDHINGVLFIDKISILRKRMIKSKLLDISKGKISPNYKMRFL